MTGGLFQGEAGHSKQDVEVSEFENEFSLEGVSHKLLG